jgi:curli biogenesis system outer membrane secretion channel CsgG
MFNVVQRENLQDIPALPGAVTITANEPNAGAEAIVAGGTTGPAIKTRMNKAFYPPVSLTASE